MRQRHDKTLAVAVDFNDNIAVHEPSPKRMYTPSEVERMLDYFLALGVRRLYWFHNAHNGIYDSPFGGAANLLAFACEKSHHRGMTLFSVIKPFETGTQGRTLPPHLEPPACCTHTVQGLHPFASCFAAEHPEMRLRFRPRTNDRPADRGVTRIQLVNQDDNGASLGHDDLDILWSPINAQFRRYEGPMECDRGLVDQAGTQRRVLIWRGLSLPPEARYVLLRYRGDGGEGDFTNDPAELLSLADEQGVLPSQPDLGPVPMQRELLFTSGLDLPPATRAVIEDSSRCQTAFENHRLFESHARPRPRRVINEPGGIICHCLDFNDYCAGALHPGYPEVRQYWLERVAASLDTGVDGVALRVANHSSWCSRPADLGFNEPALSEYARRTGGRPDPAAADLETIRLINGDFYTQFLREARDLTRQRGRRLEHFIHPLMDRLHPNHLNNVPEAFRFDYRQWLREGLLDGVCLRPMGPSAEARRWFADMVGAQARLFSVPMFFANQNGLLNRACQDQQVSEEVVSELHRVRDSDLYDGFILYEAAGVMGIDEQGGWHSCAPLEEAIRVSWGGVGG